MTFIPKSPELEDASDEERLDMSLSCLMKGIHLLNRVSCHTRKQAIILAGKQLKFEEAFQTLKGMRFLHKQLDVEENDIHEELHDLSERNGRLVDDLSENLRCKDELKKLNQDLHINFDDVIGRRLGLNRGLEYKTQQFESLKLQYTKKVP
ncbi:unnamed protein product [Lactuca virosa]|uniref:Uncharacterized protein n=1 Tax=Lactuca virosa TaxID=75947 RepID=A0AAU9MJ12_9ASTR|nr:unnamed protein product [Lactuca virosa]